MTQIAVGNQMVEMPDPPDLLGTPDAKFLLVTMLPAQQQSFLRLLQSVYSEAFNVGLRTGLNFVKGYVTDMELAAVNVRDQTRAVAENAG